MIRCHYHHPDDHPFSPGQKMSGCFRQRRLSWSHFQVFWSTLGPSDWLDEPNTVAFRGVTPIHNFRKIKIHKNHQTSNLNDDDDYQFYSSHEGALHVDASQ